jgi:hypothetical protein
MWVSIMSCPLLHIYCGHLWAGSCSNGSCTSPAPVARWNWRLPRATKLRLPEAPSELYLPKMCEESRNPKVPKATCHEPNPYITVSNIQMGNKIDYCSFGPKAKPPNLLKWKAFNIEKQVSNSFHTFHIIAPGPPLPLLLLAAIAAPWVQREACVAKPRRVGLDLCKMWHWRGVSYVFMAITYNYSTSM